MQSLVLFSYIQPVGDEGCRLRFGRLMGTRDCVKNPVILPSEYRKFDSAFQRTDTLLTVKTRKADSPKVFYRERMKFCFRIPCPTFIAKWLCK